MTNDFITGNNQYRIIHQFMVKSGIIFKYYKYLGGY